ncbi:hypothetical protein QBC44DRAFT_309031 [Cladorrhinum sp. PSN332]|nr:hypothetical protein QBC44DRAFT_309031 [Cladorrhinum sp. PSN332]
MPRHKRQTEEPDSEPEEDIGRQLPIPRLRPRLYRTPKDPNEAKKGLFYEPDEDPASDAPERRRLKLPFQDQVIYSTPDGEPLKFRRGALAKMMAAGGPPSGSPGGLPAAKPVGSLQTMPAEILDIILRVAGALDFRPTRFYFPDRNPPAGGDYDYPEGEDQISAETLQGRLPVVPPTRQIVPATWGVMFSGNAWLYYNACRHFYYINEFEINVDYRYELHDPMSRLSKECQMWIRNITLRHTLYENPQFQIALQAWHKRQRRRAGISEKAPLPISFEIEEVLPGPAGGVTGPANRSTIQLLRGAHNFRPLCWEWVDVFRRCREIYCIIETEQGLATWADQKMVRAWFFMPTSSIRPIKSRAEIIWRQPMEQTAAVYWHGQRNLNLDANAVGGQTFELHCGTRMFPQDPAGPIKCPTLFNPSNRMNPTSTHDRLGPGNCDVCDYFKDIFNANYGAPPPPPVPTTGRGSRAFKLDKVNWGPTKRRRV